VETTVVVLFIVPAVGLVQRSVASTLRRGLLLLETGLGREFGGVVGGVRVFHGGGLALALRVLHLDEGEVEGVHLLGVVESRRLQRDDFGRHGCQLIRHGRQGCELIEGGLNFLLGGLQLLDLCRELLECFVVAVGAPHGHGMRLN
jgi:hypothetical protein